jgi:hypothetical protein
MEKNIDEIDEYHYRLHPNYYALCSQNSIDFNLEEKRIPIQIEEIKGGYTLGIKMEEEEIKESIKYNEEDISLANNYLVLYKPPDSKNLKTFKFLFSILVFIDLLFLLYTLIDVIFSGDYSLVSNISFVLWLLFDFLALFSVYIENIRIISIFASFATVLLLSNILLITGYFVLF